jgi:hypothetical protein
MVENYGWGSNSRKKVAAPVAAPAVEEAPKTAQHNDRGDASGGHADVFESFQLQETPSAMGRSSRGIAKLR